LTIQLELDFLHADEQMLNENLINECEIVVPVKDSLRDVSETGLKRYLKIIFD
jgi:hypothetical protein